MKILIALMLLVVLESSYCATLKRKVVVPSRDTTENKAAGKASTYSASAGVNLKRTQGINIGPRKNMLHVGYETETKVKVHAQVGAKTTQLKHTSAPVKVTTKKPSTRRGCLANIFCPVKASDVRPPQTGNSNSFHSATSQVSNQHSNSNSNSFYSADSGMGSKSHSNSDSFYSAKAGSNVSSSRQSSGLSARSNSNSNSYHSAS